jgi:O-antigen/teichoic acid export membrane protein
VLDRLLRDGAIYGSADALSRVVAFVTFPIIAGVLSLDGFGLLELAMTLVTMGGVLVRCGMNNAVQRFYWDPLTTEDQRPSVVSAGLTITLVLGILLALLAYAFHPMVLSLGGARVAPLGAVGVLGLALLLPLTTWNQFLQDILRLHFVPWKFLGFSFLTRAFSAVLAAVAALMLHAGVGGILFAQALVLLVSFPLGLWLIRKDLTIRMSPVWTKRLLAYGAPLILTEAAFWLFSSIDRWMLASMVGAHEVGIYSAAFRISVLASFVAMAFGMAWSPYAVKLQSEYPNSFKDIYSEILVLLLLVMLTIGGAIALFSGEVIAVLLPVEFAGAAAPLCILALCVVIQATQQVTAVGISMSQKTHLFVYLVWAAAGINVLINLALIPQMGATGAAWATLVAHLMLTMGYMFCSQRVYPIPYPKLRLLWLGAISAVLLWSALTLQSSEISANLIALKAAILITCVLLGWPAIRMQVLRPSKLLIQL